MRFRHGLRFLLIVLSARLLPLAYASDGLPFESLPKSDENCQVSLLSIDQRFEKMNGPHVQGGMLMTASRDQRVALSNLLNEAFAPVVRDIHNRVLRFSRAEIQKMAAEKIREQPRTELFDAKIYSDDRAEGFDRKYQGALQFLSGARKSVHTPFTANNQYEMQRLNKAIALVQDIVENDMNPENAESICNSVQFRSAHSFCADFKKAFWYNYLSAGQIAAQLTSDPVEGFTTEQVLRMAMAPGENSPSLAAQCALLYRPALLGKHGERVYLQNPLERTADGRLKLSAKFRSFLIAQKTQFTQAGRYAHNEFGTGCPVAHCLPGEKMSGLQYFLDTIMYVYGNLPH